jgi:hypothetical protein
VAFTAPQSTAPHPPPLNLLRLPHPNLWYPTTHTHRILTCGVYRTPVYGPPPTASQPVASATPQSMVPHPSHPPHPGRGVYRTPVYSPPPIASRPVASATPQSTVPHPSRPPPLDLLHRSHPSLWSPHPLRLPHPNVWSPIHYAHCIPPITPTASRPVTSTTVYGPPPIAPAASHLYGHNGIMRCVCLVFSSDKDLTIGFHIANHNWIMVQNQGI